MGRDREDDLDRELSDHLQLEAEEQRDAGVSPEEARYAARRALGNTLLIKEDVRTTWRGAPLESVQQDLRYAFRALRKSPAFTMATLFSLALGVGLNASMCSVLNAILLRPLSAPEPDRLVRIYQHARGNLSYRNYLDLRARTTTLQGIAAFSWPNPVALSDAGEGARTKLVWSAAASANYFDVLGVRAQRGRTFLPEEEGAPGAAAVAVLSDGLWRSRFRADPAVIGRAVRINGHPFEVVGVAPANMPQPEPLFAHQ